MQIECTPSEVTRFWSKVDKDGPNGCWVWTAGKFASGYGAVWIAGKMRRAHIVSFALTHGNVTDGALLCHSCDNRACVHPAHLSEGDHRSNALEASRRGRLAFGARNGTITRPDRNPMRLHPERHVRGQDHPGARLDEIQVRMIRTLYASGGFSLRELGSQFGVDLVNIHRIVKRRTWKHV